MKEPSIATAVVVEVAAAAAEAVAVVVAATVEATVPAVVPAIGGTSKVTVSASENRELLFQLANGKTKQKLRLHKHNIFKTYIEHCRYE